jgi:hypothetical protein
MGWAWDAYDSEARARVHARFRGMGVIDSPALFIFALIVTFMVLIVFNVVHAQPAKLSRKQIAEKIISESRRAYHAPGHPCVCPYDSDWRGHRCGDRSAYGRPSSATLMCYLKDVTKAEIDAYRASHR